MGYVKFEAGLTAEDGHGDPSIEQAAQIGAAPTGVHAAGSGQPGQRANGEFGAFTRRHGVFEQILRFASGCVLFSQ